MTTRMRTALTTGGGLLLAILLLYLALRGIDLRAMMGALRTAAYGWLLPLGVLTLLSVGLRAWRWLLLLRALPAAQGGARPGTLRTATYSVMIGYMVNYAAPRAGEVARSVNLSAQTHHNVSSVLGTVVSERVLDVAVLALALTSSAVLLLDRLPVVQELFLDPAQAQLQRLPWLLIGAGLLLSLGGAVLLVRYVQRLKPILRSFWEGLRTLGRSRERLKLLLSTVLVWCCYVGMAYLPFVMLGMTEAYHLTLVDTWVIMTLGALGIVVPSPGGAGSYHYITIQTLVVLYGVDAAAAAGYAIIAHGVQLVFYVAGGALCLARQGIPLRDLLQRKRPTADNA